MLTLLALGGCGRHSNPGSSPFPERSEDHPYFLNLSGIRGADLSAQSNLERARDLTGIDFNMVLLPSIPNTYSVEEYAVALVDAWQIGRKGHGKGVLFLFVEDQHSLKIEVSYELESLFTDGFCNSFQEQIRLYFASRQFGDVVCNLINTMVSRYQRSEEGEGVSGEDDLPETIDEGQASRVEAAFLSGGAGVVRSDYFYDRDKKLAKVLLIDRAVADRFRSSKDPDETIQRYLLSLKEGINYPFLDVLLEGSQYMRIEYPQSPQSLRKLHADYQRYMPYRLKVAGNVAVGRFRNGAAVYPLLLRRDPDGYWRLDVTKAWAFMGASYDMKSWRMDVTDNPWMFAYPDYSYAPNLFPLPPLPSFPLNLEAKIHALEKAIKDSPSNASNYFALADLLFWECYWIGSAIELVERGLELEPDNLTYHWLAIEMRGRYPLLDGIPAHYEAILKYDPDNKAALWGYSSFCKTFLKDEKRAAALRKRYDQLQ
ncbi:MAG: TPM domain-containing protein [Chthoniobacterales bacterium]